MVHDAVHGPAANQINDATILHTTFEDRKPQRKPPISTSSMASTNAIPVAGQLNFQIARRDGTREVERSIRDLAPGAITSCGRRAALRIQ